MGKIPSNNPLNGIVSVHLISAVNSIRHRRVKQGIDQEDREGPT